MVSNLRSTLILGLRGVLHFFRVGGGGGGGWGGGGGREGAKKTTELERTTLNATCPIICRNDSRNGVRCNQVCIDELASSVWEMYEDLSIDHIFI